MLILLASVLFTATLAVKKATFIALKRCYVKLQRGVTQKLAKVHHWSLVSSFKVLHGSSEFIAKRTVKPIIPVPALPLVMQSYQSLSQLRIGLVLKISYNLLVIMNVMPKV